MSSIVSQPKPARGTADALAHREIESLPNTGSADLDADTVMAGPFASPTPLVFDQASVDGRWVALCQARTNGNALERFFFTAHEQLEVEAVLGSDATGRYAVLIRTGRLSLRDNHNGQTVDLSALGADVRLSAESFAALRTLSFDATSEHLLYVRSGSVDSRLVVRSLRDGTERELDPGPGVIWRARVDVGGTYAVVQSLTDDTNGNGKIDFPAPLLSTPRPCAAAPARFHTWTERGDRLETILVPLDGSPAIHEAQLVMPIGDALLLRDEAGALVLDHPGTGTGTGIGTGSRRLLAPAACKGRVVHADALRELFIIGCLPSNPSGAGSRRTDNGRVSLELSTRTGRKPLNIELASMGFDREVSDSPRLVPLYPGLESVLFDADRLETLPLQTGDVVIATRGGRALIRRSRSLLFYDADTRSERPLPFTLDLFPEQLVTYPFAFVSPVLANLDTASAVTVESPRPLALSNSGQLLVPEQEPNVADVIRGPLHWLTPRL